MLFLAHIDAIRKQIAAGTPVRHVWRSWSDKMPMSYGNFARLVNVHAGDVIPARYKGPETSRGGDRREAGSEAASMGDARVPLPAAPAQKDATGRTGEPETPAAGGQAPARRGPIVAGPDPRKTFVHNPIPDPAELI